MPSKELSAHEDVIAQAEQAKSGESPIKSKIESTGSQQRDAVAAKKEEARETLGNKFEEVTQ